MDGFLALLDPYKLLGEFFPLHSAADKEDGEVLELLGWSAPPPPRRIPRHGVDGRQRHDRELFNLDQRDGGHHSPARHTETRRRPAGSDHGSDNDYQ